jgi:hypothetical protein
VCGAYGVGWERKQEEEEKRKRTGPRYWGGWI